jgi:hypothetical protein
MKAPACTGGKSDFSDSDPFQSASIVLIFLLSKAPALSGAFSLVDASRMSALGHSLPTHSAPVPINVRFAPKATKSLTRRDVG